ncbi:hypothetical protein D3C85_1473860 [compost metagenome]
MTLVASAYTWLPAAPATESSASTSGTPAVNSVDSVRAQRAMVALRTTSPITGTFSTKRSIAACILGERWYSLTVPMITTAMEPNTIHQYSTNRSDSQITICVGAGRSAPKLENSSLNAGIT